LENLTQYTFLGVIFSEIVIFLLDLLAAGVTSVNKMYVNN